MSQKCSHRPLGSAGSFNTFSIGVFNSHVAVTYTTVGFGAGWHVQLWRRFISDGHEAVALTSANATETNLETAIAPGLGNQWFGLVLDQNGELVARSGVFTQ